MVNYGLTKHQVQKAKEKLEFNKQFLRVNGVQIDDKRIPFANFVANSYINSNRYIAELQHRAWSVYEYAKERDLKNIFITLTLPSEWHKKKTIDDKLVKNKNFGGRTYITTINGYKFLNAEVKQHIPFIEPILDFSNTVDKYTPRNASKELSQMLKRFLKDRSYTSIDKDDRCYFRVTEPHKNGTPHLHISLFIPQDSVEKVVKALNRLYPAPMGKIEVNVDSPVSYLMKYVLKTLDDLRENDEKISNLTLWYLYHGICRFYTSRTFVALEIYRKLNGMYTLRDLTKDYLREDVSVFIDSENGKISKIENQYGTIYTKKPINWYEKLIETDDSWQRRKLKKAIDVVIDGEQFILSPDRLFDLNLENEVNQAFGDDIKSLNTILKHKSPYKMNNYTLSNHFEKLDVETVDYKYYLEVRNELVKRDLINGDYVIPQSINEFIREEMF